MSEKVEVEVLHREGFTWVFQRTDRGMPSISIQGDTLSNLVGQIALVLDAIQKKQMDAEIEYELQDAFETLDYLFKVYQKYGWREPSAKAKGRNHDR